MFPLGALNVPPEIVKAPFKSAPLGKITEPEVKFIAPGIKNVEKELKSIVPPAIVRMAPLLKPVNPLNIAPALRVKVPIVLANVPVPLNVPAKVMPLGIVGFAPKGKLQLLLTVFTPVCPVKLTRLKVTLLQFNVAVEPSKVIIPLLWLKVGVPEIFNPPFKVIAPLGAVKVPPEIARAFVESVEFKSAPFGRVNIPDERVTLPLATKLV